MVGQAEPGVFFQEILVLRALSNGVYKMRLFCRQTRREERLWRDYIRATACPMRIRLIC